jgi:Glycosyl transferase family 11.
MIIVNIKNGLGNQMFQYAFGRILEWKYNVPVLFDFMRDEIKTPLKTDLDVFSIDKIHEANPDVIEPFKPFSVRFYRDQKLYLRYVYYKLRRKYQSNRLITEPFPSQYTEVFDRLDIQKKYYFLGFWQNNRYFEGFEQEVRNLFIPRDKSVFESPIALDIIDSGFDTVSLHFRRGDYLTSGFIEPAGMDYYYKAIDLIKQRLKNPFFYIFTDEPEWVEKEFKLDMPHQLVSGNTGSDCYKDIVLMSRCNHNIMANSSFSWWGAWLNPSPTKIVIAPKKWYASEKRDIYTCEITPKNWLRI